MMTTIESMVIVRPKASPKPGRGEGARRLDRAHRRYFARVDLVEDAAVAEVLGLHLRPAAEVGDRDQVELREAGDVRRVGGAGVPGAVEVLERDRLALGAVEVVEVGLGRRALLVGLDVALDQRHGRLGQDRDRRQHDLELVLAELLERQVGLVLPGEQHVADAALGEGRGRAAGAGVEHRHVGEELVHEVADLVLVAAELLVGPGPGGEIVPARAARGLRVRGDHLDVVARPGRPSPRCPSGCPRAPGTRWSRCRAPSCAAACPASPPGSCRTSRRWRRRRWRAPASPPARRARRSPRAPGAPEPPCEVWISSAAWPSACQCALKAASYSR